MSDTSAEVRQELLDALAEAADELARGLAFVGDAYERLDEHTADTLERELFRPLQAAYGRAQRTHAGFAGRYGLPTRAFEPAPAGSPSHGVRDLLDAAVEAVHAADDTLATLQDSMVPVEYGDAELRAGLQQVRQAIGDIPVRARNIARTVGR
jgi:hypothetical protein